jgi:riboflavin synthase
MEKNRRGLADDGACCDRQKKVNWQTQFMFTGIVQETGTVEKVQRGKKSIALTIRAKNSARGLKIGGSVAVNGCCLTAVNIFLRGKSKIIQFDVLQESWRLTSFQSLKTGSLVNLERPLRAGEEFGGHFVTGHVDGVGKIISCEKSGADHVLEIAAPGEILRYVIQKGSIAIDGISLTVAGVGKKSFCVWIIPHTLKITALRERKIGDALNLEADLLGKYAEKFLRARRGS